MSKTRMGKRVASLLLSLVMMLSLLPTTVYAEGADTGDTTDEIVGQATTSGDNTEGTGEPEPTGEGEDGGTANVSEGEAATVATNVSEGEGDDNEIAPLSADGTVSTATDLQTALLAGGEVTLGGNIDLGNDRFWIKDVSTAIVLDLNGYTLSSTRSQNGSGNVLYLDKNVDLTVCDSSTAGTGAISAACEPVQLAGSGAMFTLKSGKIEATASNVYGVIYGSANTTININGGVVYATRTSDYSQQVNAIGSAGTLVMTAGEVETYIPVDGSVQKAAGMDISGTATITGGRITVNHTGKRGYSDSLACGISTSSAGAVTVSGDAAVSVTANNSEYGTDAYGVYIGKNSDGTISIEGGTFGISAMTSARAHAVGKNSSSSGTPTVSGGSFGSTVMDESYLANGYTYDSTTGTVTPATTNAVAKIGNTEYATLEAAIAVANAGDIITLVKDTKLGDVLNINKNVTIDLGGHTVTAAAVTTTRLSNDGCYAGIIVKGAADVKFQNGTLTSAYTTYKDGTTNASYSSYVLLVDDTAKLTLDEVTVTGQNAGDGYVRCVRRYLL